MPDLFQLARLRGESEIALVVIINTHAARLFVLQRGSLREMSGLSADPKFYRMVRRMNAINQAHYQRHALQERTDFAHKLAEQVERFVAQTMAAEVFLAGEPEMIPLLREALEPQVAQLIQQPPLTLGIDTSTEAVLNEVAPLLREDEARQAASVVERLLDAVQADGLGVAGLAPTRRALERGQVDTLVLTEDDVAIAPALRSELLAQAMRTDASVQVVEHNTQLERLDGVGALLRYRIEEYSEPGAATQQEGEIHTS